MAMVCDVYTYRNVRSVSAFAYILYPLESVFPVFVYPNSKKHAITGSGFSRFSSLAMSNGMISFPFFSYF